MGYVYYFLGTVFTWIQRADGNISVHLCQWAFAEFTDHSFLIYTENKVPNMNLYFSGFQINSIPPVDPLDPDFTLLKKAFQSIFGCINWLDNSTITDIVPALTFLASCSNASHP